MLLLLGAVALCFEGAGVTDAVDGVDSEPPADADLVLCAGLVVGVVFDPRDGLLVRDILALLGVDTDDLCRLQAPSRF